MSRIEGEFADPTLIDREFWAGFRPDPLLTISEWSDRHRRLSQEAAAEPGRWRTRRTPYLREIMDALSPSSLVQRVVFMKGAQIGATECGNNFLAYVMDRGLGPMMVVVKTDQLAKRYSKQRVSPLIRDTPSLRSKVKDKRSRDSGNTLLHKEFPGGQLMIVNAEAAAGLRSMPIKYLFMDEIDSYPLDVDNEGDPCELAIKRTTTFPRRKILEVSTPTLEGVSRIAQRFEETDQRYYFVPCPECGHEQQLVWSQIKYDRESDGRLIPGTTRYACKGCGYLIEEWQRTKMLEAGRWLPTRETKTPETRGYHLSSLYAPRGMHSWEKVASMKCEADRTKNQQQLKVWVNTEMGETWRERGDAPDWENLYRRREKYKRGVAPKGVGILTAGVDIQRDRIEVEIVGWGRNKESWSVDFLVLDGDTSEDPVWCELREVLDRDWRFAIGGTRKIRMMAVDAGDQTAKVTDWTKKQDPWRVMAIMGRTIDAPVGAPTKPDINIRGKRRNRRAAQVWPVGSAFLKGELYTWLRAKAPLEEGEQAPVGWCHWPDGYEREYFKQLTAEHLVTTKDPRGFPKRVWKKKRERNEALDCRVYARAASVVVGIDRWSEAEWAKLTGPQLAADRRSPASKKKPKGGFLGGGESKWRRRSR